MPIPYRFCPSCAAPYTTDGWPRSCGSCCAPVFRNPLPVVVLLQPVDDGILLIRRADPPHAGGLALPGGFVEYGEPWRVAAAREVQEEAGVTVDPAGITPFGIESAGDGIVLLFGLARPIRRADLPVFAANPEVAERLVVTAPTALVFPLHEAAVARWFADPNRA